MWKEAVEERQRESSLEREKVDDSKSEQDRHVEEEIKRLQELGEKEFFRQNRNERKRQLEELQKSLASLSHGYGNSTNGSMRNVDNVGVSKPIIDWRRVLKETLKYDIDWSFKKATIEYGVIKPHLEKFPKPETEILLDTSGSINEDLLKNFLKECKNIIKTSKVKVGCFDTVFYGFMEIRSIYDIDNLPFYGGGGTNFDVAVNSFTKRVENKIIFTDGYAQMPERALNVIWIVFGDRKINPPGGKVIYIDEKQLEELYNYNVYTKTKKYSCNFKCYSNSY